MSLKTNELGHMTKMATMPIYDKTFKNHLLKIQWADDLKSQYVALVTKVLVTLFSDDLCLNFAFLMASPNTGTCLYISFQRMFRRCLPKY